MGATDHWPIAFLWIVTTRKALCTSRIAARTAAHNLLDLPRSSVTEPTAASWFHQNASDWQPHESRLREPPSGAAERRGSDTSLNSREPYKFFDLAKAAAPATDISCFRPSNMPLIIWVTSFGAVAGSPALKGGSGAYCARS